MSHTLHHSALGKSVIGSAHYDPGLLFPIARIIGREALGLTGAPPFHGVDIWNAYELSWLDPRGKPQVAIAEFRVPAASPNLIESKSFKLYLNSLNQTRFTGLERVEAVLAADLSAAAGSTVEVRLGTVDGSAGAIAILGGDCIDGLDIEIESYGPPQPDLLGPASPSSQIEETLVSHLLKSNCPVTGQPDWASVQVRYAGPPIEHAGLLRYLVSYRLHEDFHEQCVERIFIDIQRQCEPRRLAVQARYTRRGGLDNNPWRSNYSDDRAENPRLSRQ